jgi:putative transposase
LPIFGDDGDRNAFLARLAGRDKRGQLEIHAYALMPNHFHLLVRGPVTALSETMQRICGGYTQRFNAKYGLDGALLRGRFRTKPVDSERYLHHVVRYIHRNPLGTGARLAMTDFRWTSHLAYLGVVFQPPWLSTEPLLERFDGDIGAYRRFVEDDGQSNMDPGIELTASPRVTSLDDVERALGVASSSERDLIRRGGRGVRNELRLACVVLGAEVTAATADRLAKRYCFRSASSVRSATSTARELAGSDPEFRAVLDAARQRLGVRTGV